MLEYYNTSILEYRGGEMILLLLMGPVRLVGYVDGVFFPLCHPLQMLPCVLKILSSCVWSFLGLDRGLYSSAKSLVELWFLSLDP